MKKFLYKLFIYVLLVSSIIVPINIFGIYAINKNSPDTMGEIKNDNAFIKNVPNNIEICNFGSSHGYYGFNYEDAEKFYTCFNFALPSQSLRYDYKILQNYRKKIRPGATVFIVVSYFSFFGKPEVQEESFLSKNKRYYRFLNSEFIDLYDFRTYLYVNYFPALAAKSLLDFIKEQAVKQDKPWESWDRETNPTATEKFVYMRYEGHVANRFDDNGKRIYKQEAIDALYDFINLCREIDVNPILITTPYLHEYHDVVKENDPKFFDDFYGVIDKVVKDTGIKYYDYSVDARYTNNYTLFINADHMNKKGSRIFTDNLLREVLGI